MFSNKIFQITFLASLFMHTVILFQTPGFNLNFFNKKKENAEVVYIKDQTKTLEYQRSFKPQREEVMKSTAKISLKRMTPPPFVDTESIFKVKKESIAKNPSFNKPPFVRPEFSRPDIIAIKKRVTLPPVDLSKISNPIYLNYYQIVRERIKGAAYQNYIRTETGEVYLSFIISGSGALTEINVQDGKSFSSPYLRDIAIKSIKEASPFPVFPKELDYAQLSFNIIISFSIE